MAPSGPGVTYDVKFTGAVARDFAGFAPETDNTYCAPTGLPGDIVSAAMTLDLLTQEPPLMLEVLDFSNAGSGDAFASAKFSRAGSDPDYIWAGDDEMFTAAVLDWTRTGLTMDMTMLGADGLTELRVTGTFGCQ